MAEKLLNWLGKFTARVLPTDVSYSASLLGVPSRSPASLHPRQRRGSRHERRVSASSAVSGRSRVVWSWPRGARPVTITAKQRCENNRERSTGGAPSDKSSARVSVAVVRQKIREPEKIFTATSGKLLDIYHSIKMTLSSLLLYLEFMTTMCWPSSWWFCVELCSISLPSSVSSQLSAIPRRCVCHVCARSLSDSSLTLCVCVSAVKESQADGAVHGGQIQCPVVSLAQHSSFHLLPDPHAHITWTDGHCFLHFVTLSDLCVFLQSNQPFKFATHQLHLCW